MRTVLPKLTFLWALIGSVSWTVANAAIIELTSEEFYDMAMAGGGGGDDDDNKIDLMIDVRSRTEWDKGHIANATLVAGLARQLGSLSDDKSQATQQQLLKDLNLWKCRNCRVVAYGGTGVRAGAALALLEEAGFEGTLYNGLGVRQWKAAGYELVATESKTDWPCMAASSSSSSSSTSVSKGTKQGEDESFCPSANQAGRPTPPVDPMTDPMVDPMTDPMVDPALVDPAFTTPGQGLGGEDSDSLMNAQQENDQNRNLFLAQLESQNATAYSYYFSLSCFCLPADYPWWMTVELREMMMGIKPMPPSVAGNSTEDNNMLLVDPSTDYMQLGHTITSAVTTAGVDVMVEPTVAAPFISTKYSIMDLFDVIQSAIDQKAYSIAVVYNADWGYPEEIAIDYNVMMADEEFYTTVSNLTVVATSYDDYDDGDMINNDDLDDGEDNDDFNNSTNSTM